MQTRIILATLAGATVFIGVTGISKTLNRPTPPPVHEIGVVSIYPDRAYPAADGLIHINVTNSTKRTVNCDTVRVFRYFTDNHDRVVYTIRQVGGRLKAARDFADFTNYLQLPMQAFPPGEYTYETLAFSRCPDGNTYAALSDTTTFTVVPHRESQ